MRTSEGQIKVVSRFIPVALAAVFLALAVGLAVGARGGRPTAIGDVDVPMQQALLVSNWAGLDRLLTGVSRSTPSPVLRLVKAHACLAINRNDEALALFHSIVTPEEQREWDGWTRWFLATQPNVAVAHYLRGDSYARQGTGLKAAACFSRALQLAPGTPLYLNAQAVSAAVHGQFDPAFVDMEEALQHSSGVADLYCSRGILTLQCLHNREGAKNAVADFDRALSISPGFGPALIGRGCANFIIGERAQAYRDFQQASVKAEWLAETCRRNIDLAVAFAGGDRRLAFLPPHDLGMEIERRLSDFAKNPNTKSANDVGVVLGAAKSLGGDAALNKAMTELQILKGMHPEKAGEIDKLIAEQAVAAHKDSQGNYWPKDIKIGGGGGGASGEVSVSGLGISEMKQRQAQERQDIWGGLAKANSDAGKDPSGLGGAWLGIDGSSVDTANCPPFRTIYGLLYPVSAGSER